ncbi:methyltransferase [beta proteobacterium AAP99]|nr:methyltransferase [beta proteobacterium AAP99]
MLRRPTFLQIDPPSRDTLADEADAGLRAPQAWLSPKLFYDALGSRLFDAITELPEYYPTRTEAALMACHGADIAAAVRSALPAAPTLVDLGAGNCTKAAALFDLLRPAHYVAVDISADYLRNTLTCLQREYPELRMSGVGMDFSVRLALPGEVLAHERTGAAPQSALIFYPGSSIGNFDPPEALRLLREARALAPGAALLIGVDLVKPLEVLLPAYDDALGVTAAFNLNVLRRLNALLGADFDLADWQHEARFNAAASRIEMHLAARTEVTVRWRGGERHFRAAETIHTENSYKWTVEGFAALLAEAGFAQRRHWTDERSWFAVFLASG